MKHLMTLLALVVAVTAGAQFDTTSVGNKSFISWVLEESTLELDTFLLGDKSYVRVTGPFALDSLVDSKAFYSIVAGETEASSPFVCGTSTVTFGGHDYSTVEMGSQCWFAENLRSENYTNGDEIPGNLEDATWTSTTSGAQAIHKSSDTNLEAYGRLYNWYAVEDSRGLCPTGWHVPTDDEWSALTTHLGGESVAGDKMKSSATNSPSWDGSNSSGFSALPGGLRNYNNGYFLNEGSNGYWWSASPSGASSAWIRKLNSVSDYVDRYGSSLRNGFSVRCVRDE